MTLSVGSGTITVAGAQTISSTGEQLAIFTDFSGTLVNYGTMQLSTTGQVTGGFGGAISTSSEPSPASIFQNIGTFSVASSQGVTGVQYATTQNSGSFTVISDSMATGTTGGMINSGDVTIRGGAGARGVDTYNPGSWGGLVRITQTGTMTVTATSGSAFGVDMVNGGEFDNDGHLTVTGQTAAYGVYMDRAEMGYTTNYGLITNSGTLQVNSVGGVGIFISGLTDTVPTGAYNIVNSGTITAATAIRFGDLGYSPPQAVQAAISNSGIINGDIIIGANNDRILNTGTINGNITFGDGNNLVNSSHGTIHGVIKAGAGNNVIKGGAEDDTITLGSGNNNVDGGGGYNIVVFADFDMNKVTFTHQGNVWSMDAGGVIDTFTAVQLVRFANGQVSLTVPTVHAAADFNGDQHSDLLWQNANGTVSTWTSTGSGASDTFQQNSYAAAVAPSWHAVEAFDFNGDGRSDILWRNDNGAVSVWTSTATGFQQGAYNHGSIAAAWHVAAAADIDGDGKGDLVWQNSDRSISTWTSTGTGFAENSYYHGPVSVGWSVVGSGDFNGDGRSDILWRNTADGSVSVWNATGSGFQEGSFFQGGVSTNWHIAGLGDFNGDGKADILWHNDDGSVTVWQGNGAGGFTQGLLNASAATSWQIDQVGDVNADGKDDIVWRNDNGAVSIWHATGAGWAQNSFYDASVSNGWHIVAHSFG